MNRKTRFKRYLYSYSQKIPFVNLKTRGKRRVKSTGKRRTRVGFFFFFNLQIRVLISFARLPYIASYPSCPQRLLFLSSSSKHVVDVIGSRRQLEQSALQLFIVVLLGAVGDVVHPVKDAEPKPKLFRTRHVILGDLLPADRDASTSTACTGKLPFSRLLLYVSLSPTCYKETSLASPPV